MSETMFPILSVCATVGSKLSDLAIKDGQLIFVSDKHRIALDYNGKRSFYNQIIELETEQSRQSILAPISGMYYFVIDTAVFWTYQNSAWVQITTPPREILFIGAELPELGAAQTIYVDVSKREISIWDTTNTRYVVVADKTEAMTAEDVDSLFYENKN